MFMKVFPGKIVRFATLMLFTFLLAQSSVAWAQGGDQQLVEDVAAQAAQTLGWETYDKIFPADSGIGIMLNHQSDKCPYSGGAVEQITVGRVRDAATPSDWPTTFHGYPAKDLTESSYAGYEEKKLIWQMGFYVLGVSTLGCPKDNFEGITEALYSAAIAHNLGEETPAEPTPTPNGDWDLAIEKIVVLQAVEGGKLVGDWGCAVDITLTWSGPSSQVFATVELAVDGVPALSYDVRVFKDCPAGYGTACSLTFPIPASKLPAGDHTFTARAKLDSNQDGIEQIGQDPNLGNNEKAIGPLTFQPVRQTITLLMASLDGSIRRQQVVDFLADAQSFLKDVYPVSEIRIAPALIKHIDLMDDVRTSSIELDMLRATYNSTAWVARQAGQTDEPAADFIVGLFPQGHFGADEMGVSVRLFRTAPLVPIELPEALAHEIGHYYLGGTEEYYTDPNGIGYFLPQDLHIYRRHNRRLEDLSENGATQYINFMGSVNKGATWVNPDTWNRLADSLAPGLFGARARGHLSLIRKIEDVPGGGFLISGWVGSSGTVDIRHRLWLEYLSSPEASPAESAYTLEALDAQGIVISQVPVDVNLTLSDPAPFLAALPASPASTTLVFKRDDVILAQWQHSANPPRASLDVPTGQVTGDLNIGWQEVTDPDGEAPTVVALYSSDQGQTWLPLAINSSGQTFTVDTTDLPGCEQCLVRLLVSDGWQTTSVTSETTFSIPNREPVLSVSSPKDGENIDASKPFALQALGYDPEDGILTGDSISWSSDRDGVLGVGENLESPALSTGIHKITVTVRDPMGAEARKTLTITVTGGSAPAPTPPDNTIIVLLGLGGLGVCAGVFFIGVIVLFVRRAPAARPTKTPRRPPPPEELGQTKPPANTPRKPPPPEKL